MPPVDTSATDRRYAEMYPAGRVDLNKTHEMMREVEISYAKWVEQS